jgi:ribosome biogenesis GTPase
MPDLRALGWTDARARAFGATGESGLVPGRVSLEHNHIYRVLTDDREWLAEAAGRVKYLASSRQALPAVGDWVALRPDPVGGRAVIRAVLPRETWFSRKAAGRGTEEQVIAANIDTVLLVFGLDAPMNARRLERYLVPARRSRAEPVIVLNKADVCEDVAAAVAEATVAAQDVLTLAVSAREDRGLDELRKLVRAGRTLALLGPSGAGKSTIVNELAGREILATGEVREDDARGRHTSVHRQMVVLDGGGVIIDTPGMRELQLWDVDEAIDDAFQDIAALGAKCRFRDCKHDQEPGCAVKGAVEAGELDAARYASYIKLSHEREADEKRRDERALIDAKRVARTTERSVRKLRKARGH